MQGLVRRRRPAAAAPRPASAGQLLRRVRAASRASDAAQTQRLLIEWAAVEFPEAAPATLGALAPLVPERLGTEVRALEAHLYGRRPGPWNGAALAEALADVASARHGRARERADPLEPLYR